MDYKELLYRCKTKPGWLSSNEQTEGESRLKYMAWVNELNEEYAREKRAEARKSKHRNSR